MTHQGKQCITVSWRGSMNFMSITNSKAFLWIVDDHKVKACTCTEVTSWVVQNRRRSSRRWARRRCRSSVCLLYSSAWSKFWGWQNKASLWCIHWHTPTHLFPRPLWWMLQRVILFLWCNWICHKSSHFTFYHFSPTAASLLLKCDLWSRKTRI